MRDLGLLPLVPCHGDCLPHNWIVDQSGILRVVDLAEPTWTARPTTWR